MRCGTNRLIDNLVILAGLKYEFIIFIGNLPKTSKSKSIFWSHTEPQTIENEFNVTETLLKFCHAL